MKKALFFSIIICVFSCAKNPEFRENVYRGIYEGSNQMQEMRHVDERPQPGKMPPTYDQYKRERQEQLGDHEKAEGQERDLTQQDGRSFGPGPQEAGRTEKSGN